MGRFIRHAHIIRAVDRGNVRRIQRAYGKAFEIDHLGGRLLAASAFPENADIVDDHVLRRGDPEGEIAQGFQREGYAVLVPFASDARPQRLAVAGGDLEGALLREGLGPERKGVRLFRLEGGIDRQGGSV